MKARSNTVAILVLLFINVVIICYRIFVAHSVTPGLLRAENQLNSGHGLPVHQQWIDDIIQRVGRANVADLEQSLGDMERKLFDARQPVEPGDCTNWFATVLADRRVAKLYAEYEANKEETATVLAQQLGKKWLAEHKARLTHTMELYKKAGGIDGALGGSNQACASCAFLTGPARTMGNTG